MEDNGRIKFMDDEDSTTSSEDETHSSKGKFQYLTAIINSDFCSPLNTKFLFVLLQKYVQWHLNCLRKLVKN